MIVTPILSMLHEPANRTNSAERIFRDGPVLAWTLRRLAASSRLARPVILAWTDQSAAVAPIAEKFAAAGFFPSDRTAIPSLDAISAARRWADGWRGGLLGACEFDRGFHGPFYQTILEQFGGEAALLVDPSAALIDPGLIDALIDHAAGHDEVDFCFSTAAPGLSAGLLRKTIIPLLAAGRAHPGTMLAYRPDLPLPDPIASPACAPVATPLSRTPLRFTLDSDRQIDRMTQAMASLNGELVGAGAMQLLESLSAQPASYALPREVVLELTTRRRTRPIFSPAQLGIHRPDMTRDLADKIIDELSTTDDMRLWLGGVGDPLCCPVALDIIHAAAAAGIHAIGLETDLVGLDPETLDRLADAPLDVISIHIPAVSESTYATIMGQNAMKEVLENLARVLHRKRGVPVIAPIFTKCQANLAEMESWYDHWLRILGYAVIAGPSDFGGKIPDTSVVQMESPRRQPCSRISQRLTVLCDGRVVSCEQDIFGQSPLGISVRKSWTGAAAALRSDHESQNGTVTPYVPPAMNGTGPEEITMNVLAIILARAGSAGLPSKHLKLLEGKPVISYTFEHAESARRITRSIVTTDCPIIKQLARSRRFTVIARPAELASATASVQDTMLHAMDALEAAEGFQADALVCLYGNVPLRGPDIIDGAVELLLQTGCDSVRSFCPVGKWHPAWMSKLHGDRVQPLQRGSIHRRQDLEPLYLHDGAVVAVSRASMLRGRQFPDDPHAFFGLDRRAVLTQPGETVEIDEVEDLYKAEAILRHRAQLHAQARVA